MMLPSGLFAQVDEYQLKAVFLYNFAKFVDWPKHSFRSPGAPITICLLGPNPFGGSLDHVVNGKNIEGRPFQVRQLTEIRAACDCQILFVHPSEQKRFRLNVPALKGAGVLTVGEHDDFASDGGMINFRLKAGKIRLEINLAAANAEGLRISSNLLGLADVVKRSPQ